MKATREGMKSVSSTVDPFTSKSGAVMTARSKKSNDRNAELIRAQQVRKMIIAQHFVADSSNVKTPESLDSTLARLNALRTKPIKKGNPAAKRQGAKAVKKMERDAHADFLLSREEASLSTEHWQPEQTIFPKIGPTSTSPQKSSAESFLLQTKNRTSG